MAFGDFTVDRIGAKYVLGSGGSYVSYATDEPAFEFNSDGSYKGLLVEPASTNQVRNGSATGSTTGVFGSGGALPTNWNTPNNSAGLAIEIIGTGTENGVSYIDLKFSGTAAASSATRLGFEQPTQIVAAPSEVWTSSFFAKAIDLTAAYDATGIQQSYRTAAGVFVASTVGTKTLTSSLVRYSETGTAPATTARVVPEIFFNLTNGQAYDFTVRLGWAQIEKSPIATSPIPTSGSTVTRNKDDITLGSASSLIGQTEGTLYFEGTMRAYLTGGSNYRALLSIDGSGGTIRILRDPISDDVFFAEKLGGSGALYIGSGSVTGTFKCALAYKNNDYELYVNGVSKGTDTSAGVPSPFDTIGLGQDLTVGGSPRIWNDHIRAVALFTRRLSDAECIALTTL